jgi:hypothetical protein
MKLAPRPDTAAPMHWTTKIGVAAVILFMLVVAGLNAVGWVNTLPGPGGIAASVVAVSFELMALVTFEHLVAYRKARDHGRFLLAFVGLALAVAMNVEGGHRGLNHIAAPFYEQAESERRFGQESLDKARGDLATQIAELQRRVDGVAATNPGLTYPGRMEQWRANFDLVTADDRRQVAALRARLEQLPLSVASREPYPAWAPYALASIFAFFSVFGLTMFSVKVPGPELQMARSAAAALKLGAALRTQDIAPSEPQEVAAIPERAEELPPLDEAQIRQAIAALQLRGREITPANIARFHKAKVACVYRSPAVELVQQVVAEARTKRALQDVREQMQEAA